MTERSNDLLRELLACLDTVDAEVHPQELSITDPDATAEVVIRSFPELDIEEIDQSSLLWSLGFTGAKASVLEPAKPLKVEIRGDDLVATGVRRRALRHCRVPHRHLHPRLHRPQALRRHGARALQGVIEDLSALPGALIKKKPAGPKGCLRAFFHSVRNCPAILCDHLASVPNHLS